MMNQSSSVFNTIIFPLIVKTCKAFLLFVLAVMLVLLLAPIVMPLRIAWLTATSRKMEAIADYFMAMAIGMDQFGGSVLYGTEDFTVSAWTYKLATEDGYKSARALRCFIDLLFGRMHCYNAFMNEIVLMEQWQDELEQLKNKAGEA